MRSDKRTGERTERRINEQTDWLTDGQGTIPLPSSLVCDYWTHVNTYTDYKKLSTPEHTM